MKTFNVLNFDVTNVSLALTLYEHSSFMTFLESVAFLEYMNDENVTRSNLFK